MNKIDHFFKYLQICYVVFLTVNYVFFLLFTQECISIASSLLSRQGNAEIPPVRMIVLIQTALLLPLYVLWRYEDFLGYLRDLPSLPKTYKIELGFIVLLCAVFLVTRISGKGMFLYEEDGLLENLTALCAVAGSIILLLSLKKLRHLRNKALMLMASFAFFFFGMEEISWGQRIFEFGTPEDWRELNTQGETNLHNLFTPYLFYFNYFLGLAIGLAILFVHKLRKWIDEPILEPAYFNELRHFYALLFFAVGTQNLNQGSEFMEEILAALIFTRSIHIFLLSRQTKDHD